MDYLLILQLLSIIIAILSSFILFQGYKNISKLHVKAVKLKKEAGHVSSVVSTEFFKRLSFQQKHRMVENIVTKGTETILNITSGILGSLSESQKTIDRAKRIKEASDRKKEEEKRLSEIEEGRILENESGSGI